MWGNQIAQFALRPRFNRIDVLGLILIAGARPPLWETVAAAFVWVAISTFLQKRFEVSND